MSISSRETVAAGLREAARIRAGIVPGGAVLADAPLLTGWAVQPLPGGLFRLVGFVSGHPLLQDGCITTSAFLAADEQADGPEPSAGTIASAPGSGDTRSKASKRACSLHNKPACQQAEHLFLARLPPTLPRKG